MLLFFLSQGYSRALLNKGSKIMKINSLQDYYMECLRDLYDAECQVEKVLPQFVEAANNEELQAALSDHVEEVKEQVSRLETLFKGINERPKGKKCEGMKGILAECGECLGHEIESEVLDACIIGCIQKILHYQIATYGCACAYAKVLEREEEIDPVEQSLDEKKEMDTRLTELSETVNSEAASTGEEMEEEEESKPKKSH